MDHESPSHHVKVDISPSSGRIRGLITSRCAPKAAVSGAKTVEAIPPARATMVTGADAITSPPAGDGGEGRRVRRWRPWCRSATALLQTTTDQAARLEASEGYRTGSVRVLVAAQGVVLKHERLTVVINFDLPTTVEEYIDRQPIPSGARSGNTHTISFVTADEFDRLAQIEKKIGVALTPVPEDLNGIAP
ncbi:DEAD/DEAH box helicase [Streptomyces sp. NPDC001581]|uniref:DEAD/DEAH box helicase n=1 Tax=Streptomyces sp. NPDC001581 TaxID=3154386 RepID=UPI003319828C